MTTIDDVQEKARIRKAGRERIRQAKLQHCLSDLFDHLIPKNSDCNWVSSSGLNRAPQHAKMGYVLRYINQLSDHILKTAAANNIGIEQKSTEMSNEGKPAILVDTETRVVQIPVSLHNLSHTSSHEMRGGKTFDRRCELPQRFYELYFTPKKSFTKVVIKPAKKRVVLPRAIKSAEQTSLSEKENYKPKAKKCLFPPIASHQAKGKRDNSSVLDIPRGSFDDVREHKENVASNDGDLSGIEPMLDLDDSINLLMSDCEDLSVLDNDLNSFLNSDAFSFLD